VIQCMMGYVLVALMLRLSKHVVFMYVLTDTGIKCMLGIMKSEG
jgi:hypothetical protein